MLSKTAEYALRAVVYLATCEHQTASAATLAGKTQVPRRYLHRVLQDLVRAGLVRSRSGPGGGYELAELTESEPTILDVVSAVAPLERIHRCPLGLKSHRQLCPLHAELDRVYAETEAAFSKVSIQALVQSANPVLPLCEST